MLNTCIKLSLCVLLIAGFITAARFWPQTEPAPADMMITAMLDHNPQFAQTAQQRGATLNATATTGIPLGVLATIKPGTDILQYLVSNGYDIDQSTPRGFTALMHAAYLGHTDQVQFLIRAGADPNRHDAQGWTADDWARNGASIAQTPAIASSSQVSFPLAGSIP